MILRLELRGQYEEGLYMMKDDRVIKTWYLAYSGIPKLSSPGLEEQQNANNLFRSHVFLLDKQELQISPSPELLCATVHPEHSLQVFLYYNLILVVPWPSFSGDPSLLHQLR